VVGSKRLRHAAVPSSAAEASVARFSGAAAARVSRGGGGVTTEPLTHE
jgi:hypothetical protein